MAFDKCPSIARLAIPVSFLILMALPETARGLHHSFVAEYDADRVVTLKGTVTKFEWMNPHSRCLIDVTEGGNVTHWELELGGPGILVQFGWLKTTLKAGDMVSVQAALARKDVKRASARVVTLANGERMISASPADGGPQLE